MRLAVVEDCLIDRDILKGYLQDYARDKNEAVEIELFNDGSELVRDYKPRYDILLLDIEMDKLDGMRTAEIIRQKDQDVIILFITNSPHYAIKGYSVNALSYILKPVSYYALSQEMDRALERIRKRTGKSLMLHTSEGLLKTDISDICYIESQKNKVLIHTKNGRQHSLYSTLKDMEEKISSKAFVRCNSCYLVNLKWATGIEDNYVTVGGDRLLISRPRKKDFLQALADYIAGS